MMTLAPTFPDIELLLLEALVPLNPSLRFVTVMPAGDPEKTTVRIHRISGAARNIGVDGPIVDIDVFGFKSDTDGVSLSARLIQAQVLSFAGDHFTEGVIQHASVIAGPRQLPEGNPALVRFSASYEFHVHP